MSFNPELAVGPAGASDSTAAGADGAVAAGAGAAGAYC